MNFPELTIVTSCKGYSKYLPDWMRSIALQKIKPGAVRIFTHGIPEDRVMGMQMADRLRSANIDARHEHSMDALDFGTARNRAVAMASTEWVMHLDTDDTLLPHAVAMFVPIAPDADVIQAGYIATGKTIGAMSRQARLYQPADGEKALDLRAICSGVSPFRRWLWEQSPYRTDMVGAWDTALWIGFARLGARFRPTPAAVFHYRQHADSIFNKRKIGMSWARALTAAQLKGLRRNYNGIAIIVPRDLQPGTDRERIWQRVKAHYEFHHPSWPIVVGTCKSPSWSKGEAIANGISQCSASLLIIADADCIVDPDALRQIVEDVAVGAPWGMPHQTVYRADKEMTERYCAEPASVLPILPDSHSTARDPHPGVEGGGIVVIKRIPYEAFGGMPPSFRGWGSEDRALALLADKLLGKCVRGNADLLHLYHEPQPKTMDGPNLQLLRRLGMSARNGPDALVADVLSLPGAISYVPKAIVQKAVSKMTATRPVPIREKPQRQITLEQRRRRHP